jgi:agmatinase
MQELVADAISKIIADKKFPIMLGGEHSITPAAVRAVHDVHGDVCVVQFDAHADLRQEYEGEKMSHACAMARVREICPAVQLGIRNLSVEEARWAKEENFPIFYAHKMRHSSDWMGEAIAKIPTKKVYVTIDVDAFDSSLMPATGTPEPGGLGWYQVTDFLKLLAKEKKIVGFDFVELAPLKGLHACDFLVAKLAYKCIGLCAGQ